MNDKKKPVDVLAIDILGGGQPPPKGAESAPPHGDEEGEGDELGEPEPEGDVDTILDGIEEDIARLRAMTAA